MRKFILLQYLLHNFPKFVSIIVFFTQMDQNCNNFQNLGFPNMQQCNSVTAYIRIQFNFFLRVKFGKKNEWKEGAFVPVLKKTNKKQCINSRGITLLNTTYKVLANVLLERTKKCTEEIIGTLYY